MSSNAQTISFTLRCKSCRAWGCTKHIKLVFDMQNKVIKVYDALGWTHMHTGILQLTRGLPPQLKTIIIHKLSIEPHIKPRALMNYLVDGCGWDLSYRVQVGNFVTSYKRQGISSSLGISSYGAVCTLISDRVGMQTVLSDSSATIDSSGVIGHYMNPDNNRLLAISSSVRLAMHGSLEENDGYSDGTVMGDYTFKVTKEKVSIMVISTTDICQHGHILGYGPSTHEDFEATKMAGAFIKTWIESLLFYIHNVSFPEWWSRSLVQQILHTYKAVVHPTKLTWDPNTGVADCADAILNGFQLSIPSLRNKQSCWAHIWRFVMNKSPSLMVDATPAKSDLLFENLCFLQEVPYIFGVNTIAIKERLITLFKVKWAATDPTLVTYLEKEVLTRYFSKCHSRQGKPPNTNTLERFNLEFKGENYFSSVEGIANYFIRMLTIGIRISRDSKPFAAVPIIPGKDWLAAQKLEKKGWHNLGYKWGGRMIFPSEKVLDMIPVELKTVTPSYSLRPSPQAWHSPQALTFCTLLHLHSVLGC